MSQRKITINGRFLLQPMTGVQRYGREFLLALDELNPGKIEILVPRGEIENFQLKNIPVRKVGVFGGHLWEQLILPFYSRSSDLLCLTNSAPILSLLFGKRVAVTVHDLSFKYFPDAYKISYRFFYAAMSFLIFKRARTIVTVSNSERTKMLEYYPDAGPKTFAIHSGAIPRIFETWRDKGKALSSKSFVLHVGSLNPRKNLIGTVKAMKIVNESVPIDLVVVGAKTAAFAEISGELKDLLSLRFIDWKERVSDVELTDLYRSAKCFLFPSLYEGFGFPPLEAMAFDCPVIVSNVSSLPEVCGEAALYVDPHHPEDIAKKVLSILKDETMREKLVEKGRKRVEQLTWKECVKRTLAVLSR